MGPTTLNATPSNESIWVLADRFTKLVGFGSVPVPVIIVKPLYDDAQAARATRVGEEAGAEVMVEEGEEQADASGFVPGATALPSLSTACA